MNFWNKELETMPTEDLRKMQMTLLRKELRTMYDSSKFIHDRNPALFDAVSPVLGELWNERAKKLGVAQIPQKDYTDVITKLGGTVNGLGGRPDEQG